MFERQLGERNPMKRRWRDIKMCLKLEYFRQIQMHEACGTITDTERAPVKVWVLKLNDIFYFLIGKYFSKIQNSCSNLIIRWYLEFTDD